MLTDDHAEIAELLAEFSPHLRRVDSVAARLQGPTRAALVKYAAAGLQAMVELQRMRLGIHSPAASEVAA